MIKQIKIGIQSLHHDELLTMKELFNESGFLTYCWHLHQYDAHELETCDVLVLFARKHWGYLKFKKPYFLILADYVTDQKAIHLTMTRKVTLTGYRYSPNSLFNGYLCGSIELLEAIQRENINGLFYPKKYPFSELFSDLREKSTVTNPRTIITLINFYRRIASKRKWNKPENSYIIYKQIAGTVNGFAFECYGAPDNQLNFDDSITKQFEARYTLHVKYWGHVCNAVVKSLALGVPVLMDEVTFQRGRYTSYIRHGENALVFKNKNEIIEYLNDPKESVTWRKLKDTCLNEATRWHFPYTQQEKSKVLETVSRAVPQGALR